MGSGGSSYYHLDSRSYSKSIDLAKEAAEDFRKEEYNVTVTNHINNQLAHFNNRNVEVVNSFLDQFKSIVSNFIDGTVDIRFGGSISKHTYVDGISDVDSLVFVKKSNMEQFNPQQIKRIFYNVIKNRFPHLQVIKGKLAITVQYNGQEIQLLPAMKEGSGIKISDNSGKKWSNIVNPSAFARQLTINNEKNNRKLIPSIKIIKSINDKFPDSSKLTGYHIEALSNEIFKDYFGRKTTKDMVVHFFKNAHKLIANPLKDKTGQSKYVCEYLGEKNCENRQRIAATIERIGKKLESAERLESPDVWKNLI